MKYLANHHNANARWSVLAQGVWCAVAQTIAVGECML
jgi:hypothetical protein